MREREAQGLDSDIYMAEQIIIQKLAKSVFTRAAAQKWVGLSSPHLVTEDRQ